MSFQKWRRKSEEWQQGSQSPCGFVLREESLRLSFALLCFLRFSYTWGSGDSIRYDLNIFMNLIRINLVIDIAYQFFYTQIQERKCGWVKNPPLVCAHGGDSTKAFPNTVSAYKRTNSVLEDTEFQTPWYWIWIHTGLCVSECSSF